MLEKVRKPETAQNIQGLSTRVPLSKLNPLIDRFDEALNWNYIYQWIRKNEITFRTYLAPPTSPFYCTIQMQEQ